MTDDVAGETPDASRVRRKARVVIVVVGLVAAWWVLSPASVMVWYDCTNKIWVVGDGDADGWPHAMYAERVAPRRAPAKPCTPRRCPPASAAMSLGIGSERETSLAEFDAQVRRLPFSLRLISGEGGLRVAREKGVTGYCMVE